MDRIENSQKESQMPECSQYGALDDNCLSSAVYSMAWRYCRYRLLPLNVLSYDEAIRYSTARSKLHDEIAEAFDIDRELVEKAFEEACQYWNAIPEERRDIEDIGIVQDSFCHNLESYAALPVEKRHETFNVEAADLEDIKGMPSL